MNDIRVPIVVLVVVAIVIALLADPDPRPYRADDARAAVAGASVAPADARSDVWFCAAGTATEGGLADHRVTLVNTGSADRVATVTAMSSREPGAATKPPATRVVRLAAYARAELRLAELTGAVAYASATVEINGGGVLVEHSVTNAQLGFDRVPCSTSSSDHWYVPISVTGTEKNAPARSLVAIYNPYGDDAVVDISFVVDGGTTPPPINAAVVPARSVNVIDLNSVAPVLAQVATAVVARTGRVVVERIEVFDDARVRRDLVLTPGVTSLSRAIVFPAGRLAPNRQERLVLFNAGAERVTATLEVRPDDTSIVVEPFDVAIAPGRLAIVDLSSEARLTEAKVGAYSLVVRAEHAVLAAERLVTVTPGQPGAGAAATTGASQASTELVVDAGALSAADTSELVVFNPNRRAIAKVSFEVISDGKRSAAAPTTAFELQPGERRAVPFASFGTGLFTVVVRSSAPVMAEREIGNNNVRSHAIGVPSRRDAAAVEVVTLDVDH